MALSKSFFNTNEIIQIAESVSREKALSKEAVITIIEEALSSVVRKKYGNAESVKLKIDRMSGDLKVYNELLVVADDYKKNDLSSHAKTAAPSDYTADDKAGGEVDGERLSAKLSDEAKEFIEHHPLSIIELSLAKSINSEANVGDMIRETLPPLNFDRLAVQNAKSLIASKLAEIERENEYQEYKDKIGEMFVGTVDKVDRSGLTVKVKGSDCFIKHSALLRNDHFKQGDKIKASLVEIDRYAKGPQLILSRSDERFIPPLMVNEIPEIYNGEIKIISVARDPGSRTKVAVHSTDTNFDPVGACIGIKGSRIKNVMAEIGGEKIDIIQWSPDTVQFMVNALRPVIAQKIDMDEDNKKIEVLIDSSQLSSAIGRRGQNVRLISKLIGWNITIITEQSRKKNSDLSSNISSLSNALDIDPLFAELLVTEGYDSPESLSLASDKELIALQSDAIDEEVASELISRAKEYCAAKEEENASDQEGSAEGQKSSSEIGDDSESQSRGGNDHHSGDDISKPADEEQVTHSHEGAQERKERPNSTDHSGGGAPQERQNKLPRDLLVSLSRNGIRKLIDLAELSVDDLEEIVGDDINMTREELAHLISVAREKAYFDVKSE